MSADKGLTPSTSYSYTIAAYDTAGITSAASAAVAATTSAEPVPSVPTGLAASSSTPNQVSLSWSASTDTTGYSISYKIYRNGTQIATASATSYSDTGLPYGHYTYTVAAQDQYGRASAQSSGVAVTPLVTDTLTMTLGYIMNGYQGYGQQTDIGYVSTSHSAHAIGAIGSLNPSTLSGSYTVGGFFDLVAVSSSSTVAVQGFSSDPTQSWLLSASALGVTMTGASATYSYSGGTAVWTWSAQYNFPGSGTTTVAISHR